MMAHCYQRGFFGTTVDLDNGIKSETQLITKYREMALQQSRGY